MPKLSRTDWEMLRNQYHVAFTTWPDSAFNDLMDAIYGPAESKNNPAADDTDALLIGQVHAEPPIQPADKPVAARFPTNSPSQPADDDPHT